jgi:fructokinase
MITVMGEALMHLTRTPDAATLRAFPGGSALNIAVAAARLGHPAALIARLSTDLYGQELRRYAEENGVDVSGAPDASEPTMIAVDPVAVPAGRARLYWGDASAGHWTPGDLAGIPKDTSLLHVGSLVWWDSASAARILRAVGRLRQRGVAVWMDVRAYPELLRSPGQGRILLERPIGSADVVHASVRDVSWLYPGRPPQAVAEQWLGLGPAMVIVTSRQGCLILRESGSAVHWPPPDPAHMVDEAGANEAFGAVLVGALHDWAQKGEEVRTLPARALDQLLAVATLAATITGERAGPGFPTAAELEERISSRSSHRAARLMKR